MTLTDIYEFFSLAIVFGMILGVVFGLLSVSRWLR